MNTDSKMFNVNAVKTPVEPVPALSARVIRMNPENAKGRSIVQRLIQFFRRGRASVHAMLLVGLFLLTTVASNAQPVCNYQLTVNTSIAGPVNPNIAQMINAGTIRVLYTFNPACTVAGAPRAYTFGKIERISGQPFTIRGNPNPSMGQTVVGTTAFVSNQQILASLGNFSPQYTTITGIDPASIRDANQQIILPEGTYRICFKAMAENLTCSNCFTPLSDTTSGCAVFVVPPTNAANGVIVNTRFTPPSNPNILQAILRGNVAPTLLYNAPGQTPATVKIFGRLEAVSPNPFSIALRNDYNQQQTISLTPGIPYQMTFSQVLEAFGNFNEQDLTTSGISLTQLRDANNNIVLPEGVYRICFYAQYFVNNNSQGPASNVNLGCATFNICYKAGAPQFTQPITNYTVSNAIPTVRMASPVIFTWTPPIATCGLNMSTITYDLEIREMFPSQTVTDAINNPPVFIKTALRSPTYLLDTMLYKQVLMKGHYYVTRVRAVSPLDAPIVIDNGGYSRVQAFLYGAADPVIADAGPRVTIDPRGPKINSTITTSTLKGRAVWSFKKAEEDMPPSGGVGLTIAANQGNVNYQGVGASGSGSNNEAVKNAIDPNYRITTQAYTPIGGVPVNASSSPSNTSPAPSAPPNSAGPQEILLSTVIGEGQTTELRNLKLGSDKGKTTHPLMGARIFIKGVKAPGSSNASGSFNGTASTTVNAGGNFSQGVVRVSTDSPKPSTSVPLPVQLGIYNASANAARPSAAGSGSRPANGGNGGNSGTSNGSPANGSMQLNANASALAGNLALNYLMPDESKLDEDVLASGTSDASGNFTLNFIDPKFRNITKYTSLHIVVEHDDFERYSSFRSVTSPDANGDIDLGDVQLVAKSFRFTPTITNSTGFGSGSKIDLYCPATSFNARPYYAFMGGKSVSGERKTIAGKEYVKIASLSNGETINRLFYQRGYNDNFIVQASSNGKETFTCYLGLIPVSYGPGGAGGSGFAADLDESKYVISVRKRYSLKEQLPYIKGKVEMFVEDRKNNANSATFPAARAVVTVSFDKAKVVEEYKEMVVGAGAPGTGPASANPPAGNAGVVFNNISPTATINGVRPVANYSTVATGATTNASRNVGANASYGNINASGDFRQVAVNNPAIAGQLFNLFQYSAVTDSNGEYRIDKLPVLAEGALFTVTVKTPDGLDSARQTPKSLKRGEGQEMNFQFRPEVYSVTGIAVDEFGTPLNAALLVWKGGGNPIVANNNGLFVTSNYKDDSLTIKNQGYIDKTIFVKLDKSKGAAPKGGTKVGQIYTGSNYTYNNSGGVNAWATELATQPSVVLAVSKTPAVGSGTARPAGPGTSGTNAKINAATFGYAVNNTSNSISEQFVGMYHDYFQNSLIPAGFKDLGKVGYLQKGFSKINFVVSDALTRAKINGAIITIDEVFDTTTNATGEVIYKGGGSGFTYTVNGAAGSDYIIQTGELNATPVDGSVTTITILLEHGIALTGKVTSKGKNIDGAEIFVDGKDFISTRSKADGTYQLYIPKGESTIKATKPAYVGKQVNKNFTASAVENFELEDGAGHNISKLLGFDIELESHSPDGAGEKWTGSFINLKANTVFAAPGNKKLKFTNVKVTFDGAGNPVVASKEVKTDVTELGMKLFGYVPIKVKGSPQITVREEVAGKGTIGGKLQMDLGQISSAGGFLFGDFVKPLITAVGSSIDKDIPVFIADGSSPALSFALSNAREDLKKAADKAVADFQAKVDKATGDSKPALVAKLNEMKTAAASAASYVSGTAPIPPTLDQYIGVEVYGFQASINLAKCKIDATGLDMAGFVLSPELPILSTMFFDIEKLKLGTDFSVKDISVKSNITVKFSIASWSAEINSVAFSSRGFKVAGKIEVQVPQSPKNTLAFTDLAFGTSGLYGGSFTFPGAGLSIFNIINLKTGGTPLSFGEIGNTGVYKLGGSAKFSFGSLFSEVIEVPYFQIQTNGKFGVTVPVNKSLNAGFAKYSLAAVTFNTTTPTPQIDLDGQFSVDVKILKLSAGMIHFRTTGVTVDKIGLGLDIPGTKVDGYLDMKPNGFAGGGSLSVVATPIKVAIDFHYFKTPGGGVDLGASFIAGVKIPIGPVIITKVGGGFSYQSNPEHFSVTITGGASITGFEEAISLDPISITIESGPKIVGEAHLKVASLDVARAKLVIDIPNEYFSLGVIADFQPLPDILTAHLQGDLIISTKASDTYSSWVQVST